MTKAFQEPQVCLDALDSLVLADLKVLKDSLASTDNLAALVRKVSLVFLVKRATRVTSDLVASRVLKAPRETVD